MASSHQQHGVEATGASTARNNNLLGRFLSSQHNDLQREFLGFLSVNDGTNLSMVSRQFHDLVNTIRSSSYPHVIWEERCNTKIGYEIFRETYVMEDNPHGTGSSNASSSATVVGAAAVAGVVVPEGRRVSAAAAVSQVQSFRFIIRTAAQESVHVEYSLINGIWDEAENERVARFRRLLIFGEATNFPMETRPRIRVFVPPKSNPEKRNLFAVIPPSCYMEEDVVADEHWRVMQGNGPVSRDGIFPAADEDALRSVMAILWKCSQRIALYPDGTSYPSAQYLMQKLPSWLHQYFPAACLATASPQLDRETVVELSYRPAPSFAEWDAFMPSYPSGEGLRIYNLQDLPWYNV